MKEAVLIIVKPDALSKGLLGHVLNKFSYARLDIIASRTVEVTREIAKEHYQHIAGTEFFEDVIKYLMGKFHNQKKVIAMVYYGEDAIVKCRTIAGATNPEAADPLSIRGAYGRITTKGLFENLVHVSSTTAEAKREIKLWFKPEELIIPLYPTKTQTIQTKVWK